jgi:hypothetical protein
MVYREQRFYVPILNRYIPGVSQRRKGKGSENRRFSEMDAYIVQNILAFAIESATPLQIVQMAAVNKYTASMLTPQVRKQAILDKIIAVIQNSTCNNNTVKILKGPTVAYDINITRDKVSLAGYHIDTKPLRVGYYKNITCYRKFPHTHFKEALKCIIDTRFYTKTRVNKKHIHEDTAKIVQLLNAV